MPLLLIVLFIVVPIAELYVIIEVGQAIGLIPTLVILIADAVLGSLLLRQQGRAAWRRFNAALDERRFPGREVADGLMIPFGGALLLTPGFLTDIAGLALLLPPTRAVIRRVMYSLIGRRFKLAGHAASWGYSRVGGARSRGAGPPGYDVEGTAEEVSPAGEGATNGSSRTNPGGRPELPPT